VNLPSNIKTDSLIQVALTYFVLLLVSFGLSLFLFMRNPWMASDLNTDSYIWFVEFARSIFQAQSAYYAESILLPLIAKLLGATKTLMTYKLLCGLLTICILPITAIFAQRYFQNVLKTLLFIILFGFSFQYLQYYILGFPDPLTIILLLVAVFQKRPSAMFILLVLAMLSHFSMSALGALGLVGMLYFSPSITKHSIQKSAGVVIAAIACGKVLLLVWYTVFHYQLLGRLDWALGKGHTFFVERYEADVIGFWLTPGIPLLTLYFLITIYFLMQKKYAFVFSALIAIAISYVALFWTVDGLRVFAVVIAAPYAYLLLSFIQSSPIWKTTHQSSVTT
jgi:hypothetical protein